MGTWNRLGIAGLVGLVWVASAGAGVVLQTKLTAPDGAAGDQFGVDVAVSGQLAVVGAPKNGGKGAAYVFDTATGQMLHKLVAADGLDGDLFGRGVAVDGNLILVGARNVTVSGKAAAGVAYVFDATTGAQLARFRPTSNAAGTNDFFGKSVSLHGTTACIGALFDFDYAYAGGSAYLFDLSAPTAPLETRRLRGTYGPGQGDQFGYDVAVGADWAVIGSRANNSLGDSNGKAYIHNVATGVQTGFYASDTVADDLFGTSVDLSETTALIGAPGHTGYGNTPGKAYLYDAPTHGHLRTLMADDGVVDDQFGAGVALSGNLALVGAVKADTAALDAGAAYLFDAATGLQLDKIWASDGATGDAYGFDVALDGTTALVGAYSAGGTGAVYLYTVPEPASLVILALAALLPRRRGRALHKAPGRR